MCGGLKYMGVKPSEDDGERFAGNARWVVGMVERPILGTGALSAGSPSGGRRLSVAAVIPLYNGGRYIDAALRSVWAQTVAPAEIIVVNDGSTDDGPAIVARLAQTHPITILTKPNGGQSSARNMGVAHAKSDLIAFLDQDDIWYPAHIAELSRPFEHGERVGVVYSNIDEIDDAGDLRIKAVHNQGHPSIPNPISRNACEPTCIFSQPRPSSAGRQSRRLAGSTNG